jgi:hypothetical protein
MKNLLENQNSDSENKVTGGIKMRNLILKNLKQGGYYAW